MFLDTDQKSAGRGQWSMKNMLGSGLSECHDPTPSIMNYDMSFPLITSTSFSVPSRKHRVQRDNMYRTVVITVSYNLDSMSQAHRRDGVLLSRGERSNGCPSESPFWPGPGQSHYLLYPS